MKYPRTFHISFSQEKHSDDKTISKELEACFYKKEILITEKVDGGNACLHKGLVFARTHSTSADCISFNNLKRMYSNIFYTKEFDFERYMLFGENVQAIHSIVYTNLTNVFFLFAIYDTKEKVWLSFDNIEKIGKELGLETVSKVCLKKFENEKELRTFLEAELKKESFYGGEREGFVLRFPGELREPSTEEFTMICKFVRKGHVQTDKHWSKNIQFQKIAF